MWLDGYKWLKMVVFGENIINWMVLCGEKIGELLWL